MKWEYMSVESEACTHDELLKLLNTKGQEGWELVSQEKKSVASEFLNEGRTSYNLLFKRGVASAKQGGPTLIDEVRGLLGNTYSDVRDMTSDILTWLNQAVQNKKNGK